MIPVLALAWGETSRFFFFCSILFVLIVSVLIYLCILLAEVFAVALAPEEPSD